MVALWEAFYIENMRFDLDPLRAPNRSTTPMPKSNDFLRQSDGNWGARGPHFRPILGVPGVRAGLKNKYIFRLLKRPPRKVVRELLRGQELKTRLAASEGGAANGSAQACASPRAGGGQTLGR